MKLNVPFIKQGNNECGQTCVAMMIKYFKPDFEPKLDEFNKIIHHRSGKATFPPQNAILLNHFGIKAMSFSSDSISLLSEDPNQFKKWFKKDYKHAMKTIDLSSFEWMVKEFRKKKLFKRRETRFERLVELFWKGYLVCIPVNWNILVGNGKSEYDGHFVIMSGIEGEDILVHDPDLGPFQKYNFKFLKKAWDVPPVADDYFVAYGKK